MLFYWKLWTDLKYISKGESRIRNVLYMGILTLLFLCIIFHHLCSMLKNSVEKKDVSVQWRFPFCLPTCLPKLSTLVLICVAWTSTSTYHSYNPLNSEKTLTDACHQLCNCKNHTHILDDFNWYIACSCWLQKSICNSNKPGSTQQCGQALWWMLLLHKQKSTWDNVHFEQQDLKGLSPYKMGCKQFWIWILGDVWCLLPENLNFWILFLAMKYIFTSLPIRTFLSHVSHLHLVFQYEQKCFSYLFLKICLLQWFFSGDPKWLALFSSPAFDPHNNLVK